MTRISMLTSLLVCPMFLPPKTICFVQQETQFYLGKCIKLTQSCLYSHQSLPDQTSVNLPFHSQQHLVRLQEGCQFFHKTKLSLFFLSHVKIKSTGYCLLKKVETTFHLPLTICLALAFFGHMDIPCAKGSDR